ncbi:MAG TPA: YraN family protein [Anaerolineales bacterium]|nr:YraN family protein [Anaerolineales bacterium]
MNRNQRVGKWGEQAAADYLSAKGYEITARNVRTPYGEIDLIAQKDGSTIFVEVKARTSSSLGPPEIAVTPRKQQHMLACAEYYVQQNAIDHWQIDVVAVEKVNGKPEIVHFENAI